MRVMDSTDEQLYRKHADSLIRLASSMVGYSDVGGRSLCGCVEGHDLSDLAKRREQESVPLPFGRERGPTLPAGSEPA